MPASLMDVVLSGTGTGMSIWKCCGGSKLLVNFGGSQHHIYLMANWNTDFPLMGLESFQNKD